MSSVTYPATTPVEIINAESTSDGYRTRYGSTMLTSGIQSSQGLFYVDNLRDPLLLHIDGGALYQSEFQIYSSRFTDFENTGIAFSGPEVSIAQYLSLVYMADGVTFSSWDGRHRKPLTVLTSTKTVVVHDGRLFALSDSSITSTGVSNTTWGASLNLSGGLSLGMLSWTTGKLLIFKSDRVMLLNTSNSTPSNWILTDLLLNEGVSNGRSFAKVGSDVWLVTTSLKRISTVSGLDEVIPITSPVVLSGASTSITCFNNRVLIATDFSGVGYANRTYYYNLTLSQWVGYWTQANLTSDATWSPKYFTTTNFNSVQRLVFSQSDGSVWWFQDGDSTANKDGMDWVKSSITSPQFSVNPGVQCELTFGITFVNSLGYGKVVLIVLDPSTNLPNGTEIEIYNGITSGGPYLPENLPFNLGTIPYTAETGIPYDPSIGTFLVKVETTDLGDVMTIQTITVGTHICSDYFPVLQRKVIQNYDAIQFGVNKMLTVAQGVSLNLTDQYNYKCLFIVFQTSSDITGRQFLWGQGDVNRGFATYIEGGQLYGVAWNLSSDGLTTPWGVISTSVTLQANNLYYVSLVLNSLYNRLEMDISGAYTVRASGVGTLYAHPGQNTIGGLTSSLNLHDGSSSGTGNFFLGRIIQILQYNPPYSEFDRILLRNYALSKYTFNTPTGLVLSETWLKLSNDPTVDSLTTYKLYPNTPNEFNYPTSFPIIASDVPCFGTRLRGFLSPTLTGIYNLAISSSGHSQLWLSTDSNPVNVVDICDCLGSALEDISSPGQQSSNIHLVAGSYYYFEVLHKHISGSNHLELQWREGANPFALIDFSHLSTVQSTNNQELVQVTPNSLDFTGQPVGTYKIITFTVNFFDYINTLTLLFTATGLGSSGTIEIRLNNQLMPLLQSEATTPAGQYVQVSAPVSALVAGLNTISIRLKSSITLVISDLSLSATITSEVLDPSKLVGTLVERLTANPETYRAVIVPAKKFQSYISQENADNLAVAYLTQQVSN